jgi:hypothetical protein
LLGFGFLQHQFGLGSGFYFSKKLGLNFEKFTKISREIFLRKEKVKKTYKLIEKLIKI